MPSLKSVSQEITNPQYTESSIRASLKTSIGANLVWIVVEGEDDVFIYEPLFHSSNTKLMSSLDEKGKRGCENVENIVVNIKNDIPSAFILGIRDKDYTSYENIPHIFPENIFTTDKRDIETQILASTKIWTEISNWDTDFPKIFDYCVEPARFFGYLRIYNHVENKGMGFKRNLKQHKYWDPIHCCLLPDWKTNVLNLFCDKVSEEEFNTFKTLRNLEKEDHWDICRGHDLINLLQYRKSKYNQIPILMLQNYDLTEFSQSDLYKNLQQWATDNTKIIFET